MTAQQEDRDMQTLDSIIRELGITATAEWTDRNPNMDVEDMDHWKVTLRRKNPRRQMTVYFSMGYGHNGSEPTVEDVIDCLASDASGYDNARGFEDWAGDYGYDADSRKAERIYRAVERDAARLHRFLGVDYDRVLYDTERL